MDLSLWFTKLRFVSLVSFYIFIRILSNLEFGRHSTCVESTLYYNF